MRCWPPPKRPMPKKMRSTARIGTATNCLPSCNGVRAGCRRSGRPRRLWNRKPKKRPRKNAPRPSRSWPNAKRNSSARAKRNLVANPSLAILNKPDRTTRRSVTSPIRRAAERGDERKATNRGWPQRVQDAQGDRRAGLRTDQGTARFSPLQLAWQRECQPRVEAGVRGQQPAEAVPGRRGSGNGIKRREKGPVLPKTAQKACYKLPTGLLPVRPVRTPAMKTAGSALAKHYARQTPSNRLIAIRNGIGVLNLKIAAKRIEPIRQAHYARLCICSVVC